jgi:hypothetical protein
MMSWQSAAVVAALLLAFGIGVPRAARAVPAVPGSAAARSRVVRVSPFVRETGVTLALYALWQLIGGISLGHVGEALRRGRDVWDVERTLHLPSEAALQRPILGHPLLVEAANIYYATMHFGMLIAMLVWLFVRHRDQYPRVRTTIVLTTAACLAVGLVPVAPPRLIHVGMVDTAAAYGQSVYAVTGAIGADQYSAMPSVHMAWAALVPLAVITSTHSRWRWLILLHFVVTSYVVVVTANHYWADGIVAIALLGVALAVQRVTPHLRPLRSASAQVPALEMGKPLVCDCQTPCDHGSLGSPEPRRSSPSSPRSSPTGPRPRSPARATRSSRR